MDEFVARIRWEGLEVATGIREGGDLACRVEDIVIIPRDVTRGQQMIQEKLSALGPRVAQNPEEFKRIAEEINAQPSAQDVLSTWFQKSIQLSPTYSLGYSEHPENNPVVRFGFTGDIGKLPTEAAGCRLNFSWEWFCLQSPRKATKLQESGEISFELATTACGTEIVRIRFETDVSIRIMKSQSARKLEPDWRIFVYKGSEICWPSLIDGMKVGNGFVR
jgi:hypothetical protein